MSLRLQCVRSGRPTLKIREHREGFPMLNKISNPIQSKTLFSHVYFSWGLNFLGDLDYEMFTTLKLYTRNFFHTNILAIMIDFGIIAENAIMCG